MRIRTIACALPLLAACGASSRGEMTSFGTGASGDDGGSSDGGSADSADDGADDGIDDGADSGADDSGSDGGSDSGADSGPAPACEFAPGCHMPTDPDGDVGLNSHAPVGCGDGSFTLLTSLSVASYADPEAPRSMPLVGDLDGDGDGDLVVNFRKASVGLVFPGNGDGTFGAQPAQLTGGLFAGGWGGDLGDFDNDGALDVVLGDHVRGARAWRNGGGMSFAPAQTGLPPENVLFSGAGLVDVDGDGDLDALFGADQFNSGVRMFLGDGQGGWSEGAVPPVAAPSVGHYAFGDVDGDGDLDAFAFGAGGGPGITAYVLRNDGGSYSAWTQLGGTAPSSGLADPLQGSIGDVDCDGDIDVAVGGTIYLDQGGANWTQAATPDSSKIAHFADMNGDGHLDLVTQDPTVGLALYFGDGTGTGWVRDTSSGLPDTSYTVAGQPLDDVYGLDIADLDGNGSLDIVRIAGFTGGYVVEAWVR